MNRLGLVWLMFVVLSLKTTAQSNINYSLFAKIHDTQKSLEPLTRVLIKGDVNAIKAAVNKAGGRVDYFSKNIVACKIPLKKIMELAANKAVQRIEAYPPNYKLLSDTLLLNCNVIPVHSGTLPLTQAYDGSDVVIGFIDSGIDITHPDFKDAQGKTRIKYLWDQTQITGSDAPTPYNYGREWTNTQIDNGQAAVHKDSAQQAHGTHVAGIAAGNGLATGNYKGVASNADIIVVAVDFDGSSPNSPAFPIADAADYIYSKALAMSKPCVINASLGRTMGSHDGKDLESQLIDDLIVQQNGRAFVAAAGNSGNSEYHLGYTVGTDTNFTFFKYNAGNGNIHIQIYADTNDLKNVQFAIGADQISPVHSYRGRTNFTNVKAHLGELDTIVLYKNSKTLGSIERFAEVNDGVYTLNYIITPDSVSYYWRLLATGSGKFDVWNYDMISFPLPSSATMKDSIHYKLPDTDKTIESGFQCLDNVITVANYTNRRTYKKYDGSTYQNNALIPGKRVSSSGIGPTRDGRQKPDIAAPGDVTIAAVDAAYKNYLVNTSSTTNLAQGGYHIRSSGTSNAAPAVAGVAALYLQKNPNATSAEVKQAITACAKKDKYTGSSLPDKYWGYGKVDAFAAITNCASSVTENSRELGYKLLLFPNPVGVNTPVNIAVDGAKPGDELLIEVCNILGERIQIISVTDKQHLFTTSLPSGVYYLSLLVNGISVTSEKLVVL